MLCTFFLILPIRFRFFVYLCCLLRRPARKMAAWLLLFSYARDYNMYKIHIYLLWTSWVYLRFSLFFGSIRIYLLIVLYYDYHYYYVFVSLWAARFFYLLFFFFFFLFTCHHMNWHWYFVDRSCVHFYCLQSFYSVRWILFCCVFSAAFQFISIERRAIETWGVVVFFTHIG